MSWARVVVAQLHGLFERKRFERELDDEVRFHLEMQADDNMRRGMDASEARYAALRSFGAVEPMKEDYRQKRTVAMVETLLQDVRFAFRTLRKNPGFAVTSVITLGLAIGANTAMFSILNAVLFRPLPYSSPDRLAVLWSERPSQNLHEGRSAYWNVEQWRRQSTSFADMAILDPASMTLTKGGKAERIGVARTSPNLFQILGIHPVLGRIFSAEEAKQQQHLVVVSHRFWQLRYGGSRDVIGATISLDGAPLQIIGVLPADFEFMRLDADVWEPYTLSPDWNVLRGVRGRGFWFVVGRLRSNVSVEQAQAQMSTIARRLDDQMPASERNLGISMVPLSIQVTGPRARTALWMLTAAVFCVLVIAATNAASLSLARSAGREREIATRIALGASRSHIVRQVLAESLTLSFLSGLLGLSIAVAGIRLILASKPSNLIHLNKVSLDPRVLAWALALCLVTGVLVGLAPAITTSRRNLRPSGQGGGRGASGGITIRRTRRTLVVTEIALAVMLLAGAGLLIRSLWSAEKVDLGFTAERVLSVQLSVPASMAMRQRPNFYNRVLEQVESLPGVENAGIIENFFIDGSPEQMLTTEGSAAATASEHLRFRTDAVSNGFFKAIKTPLLGGRSFSYEDTPDSPRVAILNEVMARCLWPTDDAVGKRFKFGTASSDGPWFSVVGVVGDMHRLGVENEPIPQVFTPLAQDPPHLATLLVRTSVKDPLRWAESVQAAVHRVEKYAPVYGVTTLENKLGAFLTQRRFQTSLFIGFSLIALLMAAIGIYGLIQYSVSTRVQEIGIRMALGAQAGEIFRMMLREGLRLSLTGLGLGLAGAFWLSRAGSSLLFGISAADPLTFVVVSVLLTGVATAACYFPARRAMKVEPIVALRHE
jgi:putative ABC transport system permease protein